MNLRWIKLTPLAIAAAMMIGVAADADAARRKKSAPRDINKVRKEQTAATKAIKEANRKLDVNTKETRRQLNRLSTLNGEIQDKRKELTKLQTSINTLANEIKAKQDSVDILEGHLDHLRDNYVVTLRAMQEAPAALSPLAFVFASDSFTEAWRRMRYMQQFKDWHRVKTDELRASADALKLKQSELSELHARQLEMVGNVASVQHKLEASQEETSRIVADLKKEQGALKATLKENEAKMKQLDRELDRLIAEEQKRQERADAERRKREAADAKKKSQGRASSGSAKDGVKGTSKDVSKSGATNTKVAKPSSGGATTAVADENRKLNGGFESNKGRLLFPVSGRYRIVRGFGVQKHPDLAHVETNNHGIDVEVSPGTRVRSIFDGTVSAIFVQPGYNTIVMIRHGSYISIYAGLQGVTVTKGQKVKANQTIGSVSPDVENDNRAILHFELRKEREKLNPLNWVK